MNLYLLPRFHPQHGESAVDFSAIDTDLFPDIDGKPAAVATVRAGEMLFLPPYWFALPTAVGGEAESAPSPSISIEVRRSTTWHKAADSAVRDAGKGSCDSRWALLCLRR